MALEPRDRAALAWAVLATACLLGALVMPSGWAVAVLIAAGIGLGVAAAARSMRRPARRS